MFKRKSYEHLSLDSESSDRFIKFAIYGSLTLTAVAFAAGVISTRRNSRKDAGTIDSQEQAVAPIETDERPL